MKLVLLLTLSVLASTASFRLPRAANPAGDEGVKNGKGEEDEKQVIDSRSMCLFDDDGKVTCKSPGYCAIEGDSCGIFYFCQHENDDLELKRCLCDPGYIFLDEDPEHPCVEGSCNYVFIINRKPSVSGNDNYVCYPVVTTDQPAPSRTTTPTSYYSGSTQYYTGSTQYYTGTTKYYTSSTSYYTGTTTAPGTSTTESATTKSPYTCLGLGRFPDPEDCHSYYQCEGDSWGNIHAVHVNCSDGYHFDVSDSRCEVGPCTPITTTTTSSFECPSLGLFPNPTDCHKYFVCRGTSSGDIKPSNGSCEEGFYFNTSLASCVYGDC